MTLKTYLEQLNLVAKRNPKLLKLPVIYARDSEGNGFENVVFSPTMMTKIDDSYQDTKLIDKAEAVCIN